MADFLKIAALDEDDVAKIRALEEEIGKHVMAFTTGLDIARLTQTQLARVRDLEEELGVTLLVYEA